MTALTDPQLGHALLTIADANQSISDPLSFNMWAIVRRGGQRLKARGEISESIKIDMIGGNCPVQAEGTIDGKPFYFRARGEHWSFSVGTDAIGDPDWHHEEKWGSGPYDAGWMSEETARRAIEWCARSYLARAALEASQKGETP